MGYTHYWYRHKEIEPQTFSRIARDFRCLLPVFKNLNIQLAGGEGDGEPEIDDEIICFNGSRHCGHPKDTSIAIPWPAKDATGIAVPGEDVRSGSWPAGVLLQKRACDGDCSYETFCLPRVFTDSEWQKPENGLYFDFCKTAFRPYDMAVTACLVIAKHYLQDRIVVRSDGDDDQWQDAKWLCQIELGYGLDFHLDP